MARTENSSPIDDFDIVGAAQFDGVEAGEREAAPVTVVARYDATVRVGPPRRGMAVAGGQNGQGGEGDQITHANSPELYC